MSRPPLDLGYTHEMAAAAAVAPAPVPRARRAARDLTARLRCLKALIDAERRAAGPARRGEH